MDNIVKIENAEGLVRDLSSGAVINTNKTEYENYLQKKNANKKLKTQLEQNADDIHKLKTDMSEIKHLLMALNNKEK